MNSFVNRRQGASPHNDQTPSQPARRAIAANAKVSLKDQTAAQKLQPQPALPARGINAAQNSSATREVPPQQWQPGQGHGVTNDAYATDAESLDTTVNTSVFKEENRQADNFQHEKQDLDQDETSGSDEDNSEGQDVYEEHRFSASEIEILRKENLMDYSYTEQARFLETVGLRQGFRTVDGDSYPSTTDGQPTPWEEQTIPSEDYTHDDVIVPARPAVKYQVTRPNVQQAQQHGQQPNARGSGHKSTALFQQGSNLRAQQRNAPQAHERVVSNVQAPIGALSFSQPPTYSQANVGTTSAIPVHLNGKPVAYGQISQATQPLQRAVSNSHRMQLPKVKPMEPLVPANGRLGPGSLRRPVEEDTVSEAPTRPNEDYEPKTLLAMSYEDLKKESFDLDPRAEAPMLGEEILQKPLVERLGYAQKNLDTEKQSKFFSSLPTTEWEDAGDWFLDQFQSIIQRTKEARQTKRKLAQSFEQEVERRYKHVSKKQQQVEAAMAKMKQQGEGLVPKSLHPKKR
ncbi:hypothetical protein T440DRAFT_471333 [Plenodomus tracheiphilus IPT5]|uniref:Extracellular mutant protein 11 C-terminal domain-containing protein n=1 Tax=Plenodomus tracheiphilus IPT5 TaxID=1408161 RepID=A0A6A7AW50_9PLEO|nr:hypothetical protein T440DRAFT_471333 [Plenodomus tracheiphilus IPT5]